MLENVIQDFAYRMNMPSFALNEQGLANLYIDKSVVLTFEKTENELLIYITFPAQSYDDKAAQKVLELSHYRHNYKFPLFTGLFKDNFLLLTRFEYNDITAALIENSFKFLMEVKLKLED